MSVSNNPLRFTESDYFELQGQLEELKGLLRANSLLLKDQEQKHTRTVENYESQIQRMNDDSRQMREKYEKVLESQRKLEKLNSGLEEKLLNVNLFKVEKYEKEQKTLLEELTLAHAKLVEVKLTIHEIEQEKEAYREDCNLAVNLLQCRPTEFVSHSYRTLPLNLKDRLRECLTSEELMKLEGAELEAENKKPMAQFKIPVFQPTAAAAMMYGYSSIQREKSKLAQQQQQQQQQEDEENQRRVTDDGRVSSSLIAELIKKDLSASSDKAKKSFKLFPYLCMRCKKEVVMCDSPAQTNSDPNDYVRVLDARPRSILAGGAVIQKSAESLHVPSFGSSSSSLTKSKTIGTKLSDARGHSKTHSGTIQLLETTNETTKNTIEPENKTNSMSRLQIV